MPRAAAAARGSPSPGAVLLIRLARRAQRGSQGLLGRAARDALALIAAECSNWIDPDQLHRYMSFLNNHKEVACGLQQARWLRHATTKRTAIAGQPILEYCAERCPHAEQRSPLIRDPPGCDLPSKVLVVGVSPPRSGASWKGVGEPAVGRG